MDAVGLLLKLRRLGLAVSPAGENIALAPKTLLTPQLREELLEHKPEVLSLLRREVEIKRTLGDVLASLRPYLTPSLAVLEDEKLLALANWSVMVALRRLVDEMESTGKI
jgi:hypothetical protein